MNTTTTDGVLILTEKEAEQKLNRMAYQVLEENFYDDSLVLAGINGPGYEIASRLKNILTKVSDKKISLHKVIINKEKPLSEPVKIEGKVDPEGDTVILVDDVLNTGKTMFYALKPFLEQDMGKLQTMVLVYRSHNSFPVMPDFHGMSLATTLQQHIIVRLEGKKKGVFLV